MLSEISIENLTLIEKAHVDLNPGWIAITGESGAGKSVLLSALRLATGAKANADMVRTGASSARIEAIFDLAGRPELLGWLQEREIPLSEHELIISREIGAAGKSRIRLNGVATTLGDLQDLGARLIQFHGQSEQILLKDLRSHEALLDAFAENTQIRNDYRIKSAAQRAAKDKMDALRESHRQAEQQRDFLEFQFQELDKAKLIPGEEAELETKVSSGAKLSLLETGKNDCLELLSAGKPNLQSLAHALRKKLQSLAQDFPTLNPGIEECEQISALAESIESRLYGLTAESDLSPAQIDKMNERLAQIQRLKRKYRVDFEGLMALHAERKREIGLLQNFAGAMAEAQLEWDEAKAALLQTALELSKSRHTAAVQLSAQVDAFLIELGMPCDFAVDVQSGSTADECGANGLDKIEFFVTPNKGEGRRPLRASLSGGELSRIMLALKSAMAGRDGVPTLIFDEVDTGISGETSHAVAASLARLAQYHQILNITHLHQVASRAGQQVLVRKESDAERTQTKVFALDHEARVLEIARMMGGSQSEHALAHARSILQDPGALQ